MYKVGVDIGGTKCAVALGKSQGSDIEILDSIYFPTIKDGSYKTTLAKIEKAIENILEKNCVPLEKTEGIGVSCGGPLSSEKGIILSPPNLPGWDNVCIRDIFEEKYRVKTILANDANACAVAEWKYGAGKNKNLQNMIFLTFGTGFGAGLILNGSLYCGTSDMAGEIGHIRRTEYGPVGYGKSGSFEGYCSGGGIAQIAKNKLTELFQTGGKSAFCKGFSEIEKITAKDVAEAASAGDALALEIYSSVGRRLGESLSVLIDLLNPELIVIGSIYKRAENLLKEECIKVVERETLPLSREVCKIVPAVLGDDIGLYAALSLV